MDAEKKKPNKPNPYALRKNPKKTWRSLTQMSHQQAKETELEVADAALCLVMLSRDHRVGVTSEPKKAGDIIETKKKHNNKEKTEIGLLLFECISCHKAFPSHQALGGHCATAHRRTKETGKKKSEHREEKKKKMSCEQHRCGYCWKVFPSGQALGGHRSRAHCSPDDSALSNEVSSVTSL